MAEKKIPRSKAPSRKRTPRSEEVPGQGIPRKKKVSPRSPSRKKKAPPRSSSRKIEASRAKKNPRNKQPVRFLRRMKKKLFLEVGLVMFLLGLLIGRLTYIQLVNGKEYEKQVLGQQGYSSQTLPYQRGTIFDSKGTVLANSVDIYSLVLDCKQINEVTNKKKEERKYIDPTVKAIVECFPDVKEEEVRAALAEQPDSRYFVLRKKLYYEAIVPFKEYEAALNDKGKKLHPNVVGVWFEKSYQREYPNHTLASKVLGYTVTGDEGIGGLEGYYDSTLNGINGREYGFLNADSNVEKTVKEPINGKSLVTTIDINVQKLIEQKIAAFQEEHRNEVRQGAGSENMAILVTNPQNGEVLAMSDAFVYDPNTPRDLSRYYSEEEQNAFSDEDKLNKLDQIWQNYCVTNTFEPGSTAKPFTVATGLETGKLREWYDCDGVERVGGHEIHCVQRAGHNSQTVEQTLMNSCNDAMMQMAAEIGKEDFYKYQNIFGFGLQTHVDLPGEPSYYPMYNAETTDAASLATNSFGQNFNVNMMQLASAFASLINGGYYYQPHIVKKILDDNGNTVQNIEPLLLKQTVSKQTSDKLRGYLYRTVSEGTGKSAKVEGYSMGGKTGTAEKGDRTEDRYIVSFIGFAPADNPQVLVYIVIDEANVAKEKQSSALATAVAKEIFTELLPYRNIFPDEPTPGSDPAAEPEGAENTPEAGEGTEPPSGTEAGESGTETGESGTEEGEDPSGGEEGAGEGDNPTNPDGTWGAGEGENPSGTGEGDSGAGEGENPTNPDGTWGAGTGENPSNPDGTWGAGTGEDPSGTEEGGSSPVTGEPEYPAEGVPEMLP